MVSFAPPIREVRDKLRYLGIGNSLHRCLVRLFLSHERRRKIPKNGDAFVSGAWSDRVDTIGRSPQAACAQTRCVLSIGPGP